MAYSKKTGIFLLIIGIILILIYAFFFFETRQEGTQNIDGLGRYTLKRELDKNEKVSGDFNVHDGTISFAILDSENYKKYVNGENAKGYEIKEDVSTHSYTFNAPYTDEWHFVHSNRNSISDKTISYHLTFEIPFANACSLFIFLFILGGIIEIIGFQNQMKKQSILNQTQATAGRHPSSYSYPPPPDLYPDHSQHFTQLPPPPPPLTNSFSPYPSNQVSSPKMILKNQPQDSTIKIECPKCRIKFTIQESKETQDVVCTHCGAEGTIER